MHRTDLRAMLNAKWQIAALTTPDVIAIKLALAVMAAVRASDYASAMTVGPEGGLLVEQAMPLHVWAVLFWAVSFLILTGIAARKHFVVWLGHMIGMSAYAGLTVGAVLAAFGGVWPPEAVVAQVASTPTLVVALVALAAAPTAAVLTYRHRRGTWPWTWPAMAAALIAAASAAMFLAWPADGIRSVGPLLLTTVMHATLGMRSGPRPTPPEKATPVEAVMREDNR